MPALRNLISGHCLFFAVHPFPLTGTNQQSSQIITWYGSGYYQIGFIVLDFIGDTKGLCHFFPSMMKLSHLTWLAFSLRNCTKVFLSSLCEIWIPLTLFSCSDSAENKQFPDAWLSEIKNPFFPATILRLDGRMVLLQTWSASHRKFCKDGSMFWAGKKDSCFYIFSSLIDAHCGKFYWLF